MANEINKNENNALDCATPDIRTIKVLVRHCKTKDGKKEFDSYRAVQKDGKLIDCRFQQCVTGIPKDHFIMKVDATKMNISRAYEYPRLWVSDVIEFAPVPRATIADMNESDEAPLPF